MADCGRGVCIQPIMPTTNSGTVKLEKSTAPMHCNVCVQLRRLGGYFTLTYLL